MVNIDLEKALYSVVTVMVAYLTAHLLKRIAKRTQQKLGIRRSRYFAIKRLISTTASGIVILLLILIWNVNIKEAWVALTSILALVAIAFFAVWSLIGNILAGVLIYFTSPFKIEDTIEVMPDEIRGKVLAINTLFTVLQASDTSYINVPNSLFFQKYIKVDKAPVTSSRE